MEEFYQIKKILHAHYSLGELIEVKKNYRGFINQSYEIRTLLDNREARYLLRVYHPDTTEKTIRFELEMFAELQRRGFTLTPAAMTTRHGSYYAELSSLFQGETRPAFVTVFTFLPGEDKYTWNGRFCTWRELANAAEVLALYHQTIHGWSSELEPFEPSIIELLTGYRGKWEQFSQNRGQTNFDHFFSDNSSFLLDIVDSLQRSLTSELYNVIPKIVIHGDFHPGNLKFQGEEVVGLFDPDWSRTEARCFDCALTANYFCTSWEEGRDGDFSLERLWVFLQAYQEKNKSSATLGPLDTGELEMLPRMIQATNLYLIDWTLNEFYEKNADADEYLDYLRHIIRFSKWLEENRNAFQNTIQDFIEH